MTQEFIPRVIIRTFRFFLGLQTFLTLIEAIYSVTIVWGGGGDYVLRKLAGLDRVQGLGVSSGGCGFVVRPQKRMDSIHYCMN